MHRSALLDDALGEHRAALARLRATEHWRRLVAARLDLAVAAVTDIDDLDDDLDGVTPATLRGLLGVPGHDACACADLLAESGRLVDLRKVLDRLDATLGRIRQECERSQRRLLAVIDTNPADLWLRLEVAA